MAENVASWTQSVLSRAAGSASRHRRALRLLLIAAPLLVVCGSSAVPALAGSAKVDSLVRDLSGRAARGEVDPRSAYDALIKAGMSEADAGAMTDTLRDAATKALNDKLNKDKAEADKKKQAEEAKKRADQNASGEGDWDFGQVYRDRDYKVTYPLTNACKLPQVVTITYPKAFPLIGPTTVTVPAKSTLQVPMELKNSSLPGIPSPPWPPGVTFDCYDLKDDIVLTHPEARRVVNTPAGKSTFICDKMERTHHVSMHVHIHGPPDPPGGGGGGGGKKKPRAACSIYWDHGEFYPTAEIHSPDQCRDDIRQEAHEYFDTALNDLRSKAPEAWSWATSPAAIDKLPSKDLLELRRRADAQARGGR